MRYTMAPRLSHVALVIKVPCGNTVQGKYIDMEGNFAKNQATNPMGT